MTESSWIKTGDPDTLTHDEKVFVNGNRIEAEYVRDLINEEVNMKQICEKGYSTDEEKTQAKKDIMRSYQNIEKIMTALNIRTSFGVPDYIKDSCRNFLDRCLIIFHTL